MKNKRLFCITLTGIMLLGGLQAAAKQTDEELSGTPITSFYEDFEGFNTVKEAGMPSRYGSPAGKGHERVVNAGTYTGNAAENIPIFNRNTIPLVTADGESKYLIARYEPSATEESLENEGYTIAKSDSGEYFVGYKLLDDGRYDAVSPYGNVVYGGLDGYYGWFGSGIFAGYGAGKWEMVEQVEPVLSLKNAETRLGVVNETDAVNSNKLLIMDTRAPGGNHTAVFGKHNLDLSGQTVIKFRMYAYEIGQGISSFRFSLTKGEYNLGYTPVFQNQAEGFSREKHMPEDYSGNFFSTADGSRYDIFRIVNAKNGNGHALRWGNTGENIGEDGILVSSYAPLTYSGKDTQGAFEADHYYDVTAVISRNGEKPTVNLNIRDNEGNIFYSGKTRTISDDNGFFGTDGKFGILFEALGGTVSNQRCKVGIDNISYSKEVTPLEVTEESKREIESLSQTEQGFDADLQLTVNYTDYISADGSVGTVQMNGITMEDAQVTAKGNKVIITIPQSVLKAKSDYTVSIDGLRSDLGAESEPISFSFKTKPEFVFNDATFSVADGKMTVNYSVTSYLKTRVSGAVAVAVYDGNNELINMAYRGVRFIGNPRGGFENKGSLDGIDLKGNTNYKVKVYVWDQVDFARPKVSGRALN